MTYYKTYRAVRLTEDEEPYNYERKTELDRNQLISELRHLLDYLESDSLAGYVHIVRLSFLLGTDEYEIVGRVPDGWEPGETLTPWPESTKVRPCS